MDYHVTTKYVCGIDLHAKNMVCCVMDQNGKILKKKTIPNRIMEVVDFLAPWEKNITVGVESTYNWYWLIDGLFEAKIPCCLGHALYIKYLSSGKHKSDSVDAKSIAEILRVNINSLLPIHIRHK